MYIGHQEESAKRLQDWKYILRFEKTEREGGREKEKKGGRERERRKREKKKKREKGREREDRRTSNIKSRNEE